MKMKSCWAGLVSLRCTTSINRWCFAGNGKVQDTQKKCCGTPTSQSAWVLSTSARIPHRQRLVRYDDETRELDALARRTRWCPGVLLICPYHHLEGWSPPFFPSSFFLTPSSVRPSRLCVKMLDEVCWWPIAMLHFGVTLMSCAIAQQAYRVAFQRFVEVHTEILSHRVVAPKRASNAQLAFRTASPSHRWCCPSVTWQTRSRLWLEQMAKFDTIQWIDFLLLRRNPTLEENHRCQECTVCQLSSSVRCLCGHSSRITLADNHWPSVELACDSHGSTAVIRWRIVYRALSNRTLQVV